MDSDVIVAAFSEEQVERLTGISKSTLRYWDRTRFFSPNFADENRRLPYSRIYSFKDIVALRTISVLRNQHSVPLQHLRKVLEKLSHMADSLWTATTLYVLNRKVIFDDPEHDGLREVVSGQYVIGIPLKTIITDTKKDVANLNRRDESKVGKLERSRYVSHNALVVAGTRIPISAIQRFHQAGYSLDQIIKEYPSLTREDIEAALAYEEKPASAA